MEIEMYILWYSICNFGKSIAKELHNYNTFGTEE
jgi:hypothetical protein